MPFINGRFYINPAYGRAVETARLAEQRQRRAKDESETGGSHWVTIDQRHVLIHEPDGQRTNSAKERVERRAEVGYGETAGILPLSRGGERGSIYESKYVGRGFGQGPRTSSHKRHGHFYSKRYS